MEADAIVIGVPIYNFTIPSALKTWIDYIARAGRTLSTGRAEIRRNGHGKKVYLAVAIGGIYSSGPMKPLILRNRIEGGAWISGDDGYIATFRAEALRCRTSKKPRSRKLLNRYVFNRLLEKP